MIWNCCIGWPALPSPARTTILIVFALPGSDEAFEKYVNIWIQISKSLGVMDLAYEHWILGRDRAEHNSHAGRSSATSCIGLIDTVASS